MNVEEYNDNMVRSAIKEIRSRPGWSLQRIASTLNVDYATLCRQFVKRGIKITDIRKTKKGASYQKFECHNREGK